MLSALPEVFAEGEDEEDEGADDEGGDDEGGAVDVLAARSSLLELRRVQSIASLRPKRRASIVEAPDDAIEVD